MNTTELLADLTARGVTLTLDGDDLLVDGVHETLTDEVIESICGNKPSLVAALRTPAACPICGCAIGWRNAGIIVCAACRPGSSEADLLVLVNLPAGNIWLRLGDEHADRQCPEQETAEPFVSWDDCISWDESTPHCATCQSAAGWIDARDGWHCMKCNPPTTSRRLLRDRDLILHRRARRNGGRP